MIVEIADITIQPGKAGEFAAAIKRGVETVIAHAPGYRNHRILHGIESPERFVLLICWDSVAAHNEGFRKSPAFGEWRAIVGPYFDGPPKVEHFDFVD